MEILEQAKMIAREKYVHHKHVEAVQDQEVVQCYHYVVLECDCGDPSHVVATGVVYAAFTRGALRVATQKSEAREVYKYLLMSDVELTSAELESRWYKGEYGYEQCRHYLK